MSNGRTSLQEALFNIQELSALLWGAMTVNKGRTVTLENQPFSPADPTSLWAHNVNILIGPIWDSN